MILLGDEAQVEAWFRPFGDSANLDTILVRVLRWTYHRLRNHFGRTWWNSFVMWALWNLVSVHLKTLLVSVHDLHQMYHWLKSHFGHTWSYSWVTRLKWKLASVYLEIVLILIQDRCTLCAEHTTGLEIIFDTPDGTSRQLGSCGISFQSVWR
jgi:hypothetical protein